MPDITAPIYEHKVKILVYGPTFYHDAITPVNSVAVVRDLSCTLSKDILNQMVSSLEFTVEDAEDFFNQFRQNNPLQHGALVEMYLNDVSGGIETDPLPVDGWIKKFTGYIIDPDITAAAGSRAMTFSAKDRMWAVLHARARVRAGTPTEFVNARLEPYDASNLIWQVIDENGDSIIDLDDQTMPIVTRFVQTAPVDYDDPEPAGPMVTMQPNAYSVNYGLGRIVFKNAQRPKHYGDGDRYGYWVMCHRYHTDTDPYLLEDALSDFLTNVYEHGGVQMIEGIDFNFYDLDGDTRFDAASFNITTADPVTDTFQIAGNFTVNFPTGSYFSVHDSTGNNGNYTVVAPGGTFVAGFTTIPVDESVDNAVADGFINEYADTRIFVSNIDWDEDSGSGQDYIEMLREAGVMPYNYFMYCNPDGEIMCRYILQSATADKSISREIFLHIPDSIDDIFTRCIVVSNGNTYPRALINADTATLTYRCMTYGHGNTALPVTDDPDEAGSQDNDADGVIDHWLRFPFNGSLEDEWLDHFSDDSILSYAGLAAVGTFKHEISDYPENYTEFFYPFPAVPAHPGKQDSVIFCDITFTAPLEVEIDKLLLQMYIPIGDQDDKDYLWNLRRDGDSRGPYDAYMTLFNNTTNRVNEVLQRAQITVLYSDDAAEWGNKGLGPAATAFEMDPTKSDTKIIKVEKAHKIRRLRIIFHRPFVCSTNKGRRVAMYFLNAIQAYDRGTIYLPDFDVNNERELPFARMTGTDTITSLVGETNTVTAVVDAETFTTPNGTIEDYTGCFICVPDATNEVFIAEVVYNDRDTPGAGTQTIGVRVIEGKTHTDLNLAGVVGGITPDTWYLMNNRYWLDLLYNRIDLYRPRYYNKMNHLHLPWKTEVIENDEITDLGTALRKATTVVNEAMANLSGVELNVAFRPDYDVGLTVDEPVLQTPRYLITALDYVFDGQSATASMKIINYDQLLS